MELPSDLFLPCDNKGQPVDGYSLQFLEPAYGLWFRAGEYSTLAEAQTEWERLDHIEKKERRIVHFTSQVVQ